jgi:peptidoglycan/LPS O-acetylase OafA/YrhL
MNPSLWSIPVEVEFYHVYLLLLLIWHSFGSRSAVAFTFICTGIGGLMFLFGSKMSGVSFFSYAVIWNSGAWLAELYANERLPRRTKWHGLAMVAAVSVTLLAGLARINDFYLNYGWALFSFLLLFWALGPEARCFNRQNPMLQSLIFTGVVSYSLYLLHFPIFKLAGASWRALFGGKPESFLIPKFATILMVQVAWLFYRFVELPCHRFGQRWQGSSTKR